MRRYYLIILSLICAFALHAQEYQLAKPLIKVEGGPFFEKQAMVVADFRLEGAKLFYTLDSSEPSEKSKRYRKAIKIKTGSTFKVKAFKEGFIPSETVTTELVQLREKVVSATVSPEPSKTYAGDGAKTLADRQGGSLNFRDGNWLGYNEGPITITLDLGEVKPVNEVIISTLTSSGSWIMPPTSISVRGSFDGIHFIGKQELDIPRLKQEDPSGKAYYKLSLSEAKYRFIELVISPLDKLPSWHPGKGNAAWVFLDEIIIN
ncbi:chitobiase/beta-hexosaminidase C-terminal domain-containing protein [Roseivirga sp. E12]|uniref:chitobiase/beta-hexosaminidase C-terminal domain-containing protein n=1 Tax=Roseivirga sp. E12 TaxID=2819237 RepID=UPI001ABC3E67|nr:chitobiase/beta-hexosaminidase C-terminal domain-containing protein [Roseivirga sp. E12]MBO3699542.1 chitobiase/beta-hexosaminidase C-terminal domain-containing protein [Roseivirga sp. E12]